MHVLWILFLIGLVIALASFVFSTVITIIIAIVSLIIGGIAWLWTALTGGDW